MNEDHQNALWSMACVFVAGFLLSTVIFTVLGVSETRTLKHILSHVPKGHVLKAKDQIASEKITDSESERHLSYGTKFDVGEVKP